MAIIQMKKEETRRNLICYFLAIAVAQQSVQKLQDSLILHPNFNPIALFKKISKDKSQLSKKQYMNYIMKKVGSSIEATDIYLKKHGVGDKIECGEFIQWLLPYTPDVLRNANSTIMWQVSANDQAQKIIQKLFIQIVKNQIYHLLKVSTFRKKLKYTWAEIQQLIQYDLQNEGPILQRRIQILDFDIMVIRRWMELWIKISEKQIINIMRWMGGGTLQQISHFYNNIFAKEQLCTCSWSHKLTMGCERSHSKKKINISVRQKSIASNDSTDNKFAKRYGLPIQRYQKKDKRKSFNKSKNKSISRSKDKNKIGFNNSKKNQFPSVKKLLKKIQNKSNEIPEFTQNFQSKKQGIISKVQSNQGQSERAIEVWCEYVHTILESERNMSKHRQNLYSLDRQVQQILKNQVMSKKKSITPIKKLINFIDRHIPLQNSIRKNMETHLMDLAMDNSVIQTIFTTKRDSSTFQTNISQNSSKTPIIKQVANILNTYCQTKSKLIQLSKIAVKDNLHKMIFEILDVGGNRYITGNGLSDIMEEMGIGFKQLDIQILMKHFGDGKLITDISFVRVFDVQAK